MEKSFLLSAEKLDELFVQEVACVVHLVCRLPTKDQVIPICVTWLKIFQRAKVEELFARNSMLLLLHKQLNDRHTLDYPFTDHECTKMDLRALHHISLGMNKRTRSAEEKGREICERSSLNELYSLRCCNNNLDMTQGLIETNQALTRKWQALQLQNQKLQDQLKQIEKAKQLQIEQIGMLDREYCYLKRTFACSAIKALKLLCTGYDPAKFFDIIYKVLCCEKSDIEQTKFLGKQFNDLLQAHVAHYQRKQLAFFLELANQKYDELRAKASKRYKVMVDMKLDAEEKEIILNAMRNMAVLRKVFIATFKGKSSTKQAALKFLQLSYQQMAKMLTEERDAALPGN
ncbi:uncharacterized protein LOC110187660 [Drosophila serrata]|uniref:uncharacterized protein LOC110187660 n=1 Tax=Drosophila serrata TaxID=7274 RepID=UPI000A1D145F|nr:uncharacterized protein LOC110187660 [Drosophila serrata]